MMVLAVSVTSTANVSLFGEGIEGACAAARGAKDKRPNAKVVAKTAAKARARNGRFIEVSWADQSALRLDSSPATTYHACCGAKCMKTKPLLPTQAAAPGHLAFGLL